MKKFKIIEEKLNEFFINDKKIDIIKNSIIKLKQKREYLECQIKELKINFDISIKGSSISGMPIASINTTSYFEKDIIKQVGKSQELLNNINIEIIQLENDLLMLQMKNETFYRVINMLNTNSVKLLTYKYKENLSEIDIAYKLNMSITHYHRKKRQVLDTISKMLIFYKNVE
nr:hypothetical protein [uncultured Tyzzerella sp.]